MSRFCIKSTKGRHKGREYVYGFDPILSYYFLDRLPEWPNEPPTGIVGYLTPTYGSAANLLEACERRGIVLPRRHREELLLDLPLSEAGYEDNETEDDQFESALDQWGVG